MVVGLALFWSAFYAAFQRHMTNVTKTFHAEEIELVPRIIRGVSWYLPRRWDAATQK